MESTREELLEELERLNERDEKNRIREEKGDYDVVHVIDDEEDKYITKRRDQIRASLAGYLPGDDPLEERRKELKDKYSEEDYFVETNPTAWEKYSEDNKGVRR